MKIGGHDSIYSVYSDAYIYIGRGDTNMLKSILNYEIYNLLVNHTIHGHDHF